MALLPALRPWLLVLLLATGARASLVSPVEPLPGAATSARELRQAPEPSAAKPAEARRSCLRARWMDPTTGRFVSEDPYEGDKNSPVSLHRFLYANSGPVNSVDHDGRMALSWQMAGVVGLGILSTLPALNYTITHTAPLDLGLDIDFHELNREVTMMAVALSTVISTTWDRAIEMYRAEAAKARAEAERRRKNKGTKYELLIRGPSKDNGATRDNWGKPDPAGYKRWYMEGGPSGRIKGIGLWAPKSGIGSHIEIGEFDNHPIKGDPQWGPDKWQYVYHFHIGPHSNGNHYVIGAI